MPTYSGLADLMLGDIPVPRYIDQEKVIQDASDEIDSHIGFIYKTPIDMAENGPVSRPARLLLKRISSHLASGRLIMAIDSSGQNDELHNYGIYLVRQAEKEIRAIVTGATVLDGVEKAPKTGGVVTAPLIHNVDARSHVEAFYGMVTPGAVPYRPHGTF